MTDDARPCRYCGTTAPGDDIKPIHPRTHWGASQRQRGGNGFSRRTVLTCASCRKTRRGRWSWPREAESS